MPERPLLCLIAAMDRNRLIGVRGERMPWHLPEDLKHFRRSTIGRPVIMGRRTYASIGRPLPGRLNIVLTRGSAVAELPGQVVTAASLDDARRLAEAWLAAQPPSAATPVPNEVFVIGGAEVYAQAIDLADRLVITEIDAVYDGDNHFPDYRGRGWMEVSRETLRSAPPNEVNLAFVRLERRR